MSALCGIHQCNIDGWQGHIFLPWILFCQHHRKQQSGHGHKNVNIVSLFGDKTITFPLLTFCRELDYKSEKSLSEWKLQGGAGLPRYCFPFLGFPLGSKSRPGPAPPHIRGLIFHSYTAHIFITNSIYVNSKLMSPFETYSLASREVATF